jgi:hypothetical protein
MVLSVLKCSASFLAAALVAAAPVQADETAFSLNQTIQGHTIRIGVDGVTGKAYEYECKHVATLPGRMQMQKSLSRFFQSVLHQAGRGLSAADVRQKLEPQIDARVQESVAACPQNNKL